MNQICQLNKDRGNFDVNERSAAFHSDRISEDIFFSAGTLSIKKWKIQWASQKPTNARVYQDYMESNSKPPSFSSFQSV